MTYIIFMSGFGCGIAFMVALLYTLRKLGYFEIETEYEWEIDEEEEDE